MIDTVRSRLGGTEPDRVVSAVVPFVDRPLVPLTEGRRSAFAQHVRTVVAESFSATPDSAALADLITAPEFQEQHVFEKPEPPVAGAACAACRGECCLVGGLRNAFISRTTVDRYRMGHPAATPVTVVDYFVGHLPVESVQNSCVYHGAAGCALPRSARSSICNGFLCWFRREFDEDYARSPANGAVIAAVAQHHVKSPEAGAPCARVVSVTETGRITAQDDLHLPALSAPELAPFAKADAAVSKRPPDKRGR